MQIDFLSFHTDSLFLFKISDDFSSALKGMLNDSFQKIQCPFDKLVLSVICLRDRPDYLITDSYFSRDKQVYFLKIALPHAFRIPAKNLVVSREGDDFFLEISEDTYTYDLRAYSDYILLALKDALIDQQIEEEFWTALKLNLNNFLEKILLQKNQCRYKNESELLLEELNAYSKIKKEDRTPYQQKELTFYENTWVKLLAKVKFDQAGNLLVELD